MENKQSEWNRRIDKEINERMGRAENLFNIMRSTFLGKREVPNEIKTGCEESGQTSNYIQQRDMDINKETKIPNQRNGNEVLKKNRETK